MNKGLKKNKLVQNEQCLPVIGRKVLQKGPNPDRIRIKNNPDPHGLNINLYFTFDFTLILKLTVIIIIKIVAKVLNNIIFENKATGSQIILELVPVGWLAVVLLLLGISVAADASGQGQTGNKNSKL